ncbi:MAG: hypothetical protein KKD25_03225 [Gammaproteobacteria bacterium]|jgi:hypothetical protein|nr:hypothetical protein [Gammaproteobacteria bacterium]MBU0771953.1 hypothetical protein [Gammaproteobacteria bacterium]MBU0855470.1 hypothetical protein [Gammaproteobacteria bacterium]MBU1845714.1 hypothetical protein [Gammaproteobacteria bacterium]
MEICLFMQCLRARPDVAGHCFSGKVKGCACLYRNAATDAESGLMLQRGDANTAQLRPSVMPEITYNRVSHA